MTPAKAHAAAEAEDMKAWPTTLQRLVAVIGKEQTLKLAKTVGGLERVMIPKSPLQAHMWRDVLGAEDWARVVATFAGERLDLPRACFLSVKKWAILDLASEGLAHRQIALRAHCTERYVRMVLEGQPKIVDDRQQKLFGDDT